jgi:signal transduction histidine kinase
MSAVRQQPTAPVARALLLSATAADRERRRLERDLHDGAQQRLVSLSMRLRLLASRLAPGSEAERLLADARNELAAALKELGREIPLAQNEPERAGCSPRFRLIANEAEGA